MAITSISINSIAFGAINISGDGDLRLEDLAGLPAMVDKLFGSMAKQETPPDVSQSLQIGDLADMLGVECESITTEEAIAEMTDRVRILVETAEIKGAGVEERIQDLGETLGVEFRKLGNDDEFINEMNERAKDIIADLAAVAGAAKLLCIEGEIDTEGVDHPVKLLRLVIDRVQDARNVSHEVGVLVDSMRTFGFEVPKSLPSNSKMVSRISNAMDLLRRAGWRLVGPPDINEGVTS